MFLLDSDGYVRGRDYGRRRWRFRSVLSLSTRARWWCERVGMAGRRIGDRVGSFTNRARMAKLLALMTLDLSGKADGREWADRLRERLYLAGGRTNNQRPHDDPKGSYSLIA